MEILYEDAQILVVVKPPGMESQAARRLEPDMVSELKNYLRLSTELSPAVSTGGEPYLGIIHRLDRPVGGVMVYARTKQAAAALSRQVKEREMEKTYRAVICGKPVDIVGNFVDYLLKDGKNNLAAVVDKSVPGAKRALLSYRVLAERNLEEGLWTGAVSLVQIRLETGRHHQIRAQFASRGLPLWGDRRYNPFWQQAGGRDTPALFASGLSFIHPRTGRRMEFTARPAGKIWEGFDESGGTL